MASGAGIVELIRTNDSVRLSWVIALLAESEIESLIFDTHTSFAGGSVGAIQRRLMVAAEDEVRARMIIEEADIV
tara:strand:- start:659 stop:883 length:225 start_codon:yes stop_codon:yes gene_type:complete